MSDPSASAARLAPLVAIVFFGFIAVGLPLPAIPIYVHETLAYGPVIVGWAVGVQSLVTIMTRGVAGGLCDGRGAKTAVMLGLPAASLAGVAYLGSAALVASPGLSLAVLFVGRMALGLAESLFLVGGISWGIARIGPQHTGKVMAWQGVAMYTAMGLGAPVGLLLQQRFGFMAVGVAVIVLPLFGLIVAALLPGAAATGQRPKGGFFRMLGVIWPLGLAVALGTAPFAIMYAFLSLHFEGRGWTGAGLAMFGLAAGFVAVRFLFGHLPDRVKGLGVAVVSLSTLAAGQALLWLGGQEWIAIAGAAVTGAGYSLVFPAFGVRAVRLAPAELRGAAVGAYMAFFDLALGVTGPIAGLVAARFGFASVFLLGTLTALAAIAVAYVSRAKTPA